MIEKVTENNKCAEKKTKENTKEWEGRGNMKGRKISTQIRKGMEITKNEFEENDGRSNRGK